MTLADLLLEQLNDGNWHSRSELARAIGRKRGVLGASDIGILKALEATGAIEVRTAVVGAVLERFEYRRKSGGA